MAEAILGRCRRQFPDPGNALQPRDRAAHAARQRGRTHRRSDPVPRRGDRRAGAQVRRRHHHAAGLRCLRDRREQACQRFYDEGEDIWPKRYAIWGRLVAAQPDQIAYSSSTPSRSTCSCRRCFRRSGPTPSASWRQLGLDPTRWKRPSPGSTGRSARYLRRHETGRLPDRGLDTAQDRTGPGRSKRALLRATRFARASPSPISAPAWTSGLHPDGDGSPRPTCSRRERSWPATSSARAMPPESE